MTVSFRHAAEFEAGGYAAYFRTVAGRTSSERLGGLLQVNGRGEPIEFTFSSVKFEGGSLWRAGDLERGALRSLAVSLFEGAQRSPLLLLCLAKEVPPELFRDELEVEIPVCRAAAAGDMADIDSAEIGEERATVDQIIHLFWCPGPPTLESPARRLLDELASRSMLLEPFDRIPLGLREALSGQGE